MDIEKKPYPKIAQDAVLAPLGMTNSTYNQPLSEAWLRKAASGHRGDGSLVVGKIHVYPEMAAAGLWTTPSDLAKFAIEVQLSYAGRSNKILSKEMTEKMVTPFMEQVGLGFFIDKRGNALYFGHDGADEGFRAMLLMSRDKGYGAVVMVNSDNGQIMPEVLRSIAREYIKESKRCWIVKRKTEFLGLNLTDEITFTHNTLLSWHLRIRFRESILCANVCAGPEKWCPRRDSNARPLA